MAKMTRQKLKGIVKECLVEILSEGINTDNAKSAAKQSQFKRAKKAEEERLAEHRKKFEYKVKDTVSAITDDPVMASIFEDTAATTLQEQLESRGQGNGLVNPDANDGVNLDGIFGNASANWEKLAFESKSPSR